MNPIGQTFPVIHMHLVGNSEQPPQLLNVGTSETSSDKSVLTISYFLLETNIQIPTVINASHIVAEIFHDYGIHHLTCEFKTFQTKLFEPYRLSVCRKYFANDVYDNLSHPMLRQSSPKNMTFYFNSRQTKIAERYALTQYFKSTRWYLIRPTYFKYTDFQYSTVDQLISKTIILYVSVITVPKNVTCHFNLRIT